MSNQQRGRWGTGPAGELRSGLAGGVGSLALHAAVVAAVLAAGGWADQAIPPAEPAIEVALVAASAPAEPSPPAAPAAPVAPVAPPSGSMVAPSPRPVPAPPAPRRVAHPPSAPAPVPAAVPPAPEPAAGEGGAVGPSQGEMAGPVGMSGSSAGGGEGGAAAAGGGARREAEPLDTPPPPYPPSARRRGLEGRVVLDLTIDAGGRTVAVALVRSSGVGSLDDAAREAVAGWRFRPAHRDGQPVESRRQVPIRFQLNGLALAHGD